MPDHGTHPLRDLEAAARSMADAILTIDEEGCIVYASPAVRELLGYGPEELIGGPLTVIIPEDLRQRHANFRHIKRSDPLREGLEDGALEPSNPRTLDRPYLP